MRKEIVWNVGMHSQPKCLNKLSMNEAVNVGDQRTTITHAHTRTHTETLTTLKEREREH